MVGGELCIDTIWCNKYSNKTLISYNDGASFMELAPIPALLKGHCAVLLNNTTLMVIGGYKFPISLSATYFFDLDTNTWSSGPSLMDERSYHTCNLITDCEGSQHVVVVGGTGTGFGDYRKSVEIYDVSVGTWSTGKYDLNVRMFDSPQFFQFFKEMTTHMRSMSMDQPISMTLLS